MLKVIPKMWYGVCVFVLLLLFGGEGCLPFLPRITNKPEFVID